MRGLLRFLGTGSRVRRLEAELDREARCADAACHAVVEEADRLRAVMLVLDDEVFPFLEGLERDGRLSRVVLGSFQLRVRAALRRPDEVGDAVVPFYGMTVEELL